MTTPLYLRVSMIALAILSAGLSAQTEGSAGFSDQKAIEKRLEATQAELAALPGSADPVIRESLGKLEAACQYHLGTLEFLTIARNDIALAEQEATAWNGFSTPPPYPVLQLDRIRGSLAVLENSQRTAEAQVRIFKSEVDSLGNELASRKQDERRFLETAENSGKPEVVGSARRSAKLENLSTRIIAERIGRRQLRITTENAKLSAIARRMELARRQVAAINGEVVFAPEVLDDIQNEIASERSSVSLTLAMDSKNQLAPDPLLRWRLEFLDLKKTFWNTRFSAINTDDRKKKREAIRKMEGLQTRINDWMEIAQLRLTGGDSETVDADPTLLRDGVEQLREMQRLVGFALNDLKGESLTGHGTTALQKLSSTLLGIWNAELYLVEESDIVDGRKVAIYRAVTTAKLVRLAIILIIGWFALRFIAGRVHTAVARRGRIPKATADLAGKWAFGTGLLLLVIYGLHAVSIPLTIFAFLGGALAIGIGFGTQTLLKNFISGIILIFERPLKIGDVIEVAGIIGTIKFIGIRASVIQHFDGIETLVPNSILLENQLTNWSFSNTVIRHFISVGVAYGSPTREVSRLLLAIAAEHGLVAKDPAPEVRFEDFADNALTFQLLFWFDTRKTPRATLASDLRYMIEKAFAEAGVTISFPQRDLHFDADSPLRVELSRAQVSTESRA